MSHKFHGKGSGRKKTEKRVKKLQEEFVSLSVLHTYVPSMNTDEAYPLTFNHKWLYLIKTWCIQLYSWNQDNFLIRTPKQLGGF